MQPSGVPTGQPSMQPSSQPSDRPSIHPSSVPSSQPSSRPTGQPSRQPSSVPSRQPSSAPSRLPTSQPSQSPTILYKAPEVVQTYSNVSSSSTVVTWGLDENCKFAGTLYSGLFSAGSNVTTISQIQAAAVAVQYQSYQRFVAVQHSGLTPYTSYDVYAYVETLAGYVNSKSVALATKQTFTTGCCRSMKYTQSPAFVYADASKYASLSSDASYSFRYSLSTAPSTEVTIVPLVQYVNGTTVSSTVVSTYPTSTTFTSSSSAAALQGSFILKIGSLELSEWVSIVLNATGSSAYQYGVTKVSMKVKIVGSGGVPPAPSLSGVIFGDSGKDFYVLFDSWTNMGGKDFRETWSCSDLLSFEGSNATTCSWLNLTAIAGVFPSTTSTSSVSLVSVGGNVTLRAGRLKPYCKSGGSVCDAYNASASQTVSMQTATNAVTPSVVLVTASRVGSCDNVSINAMLSNGNGGRPWTSATWSVYALDGDGSVDVTSVQSTLSSYGTSLGQLLILPRSYFKSGKITLSLTLTNFFGKSATGSVAFTVVNEPLVPNVYIAGAPMVYMRAYSAFTAYSSVSFAACSQSSASSVQSMYQWAMYAQSTGRAISTASTSRAVAQYSIPSFSLTAGEVYQLELNVTLVEKTSGQVVVYSSATQGVTVLRGQVYARVAGGSVRQFPTNKNYTLSAASSYDEDATSTRLWYDWSCSVTSLLSFGTNCTELFGGYRNSSSATVPVYGSALNVSLVYGVTATVRSSDGRTGSTTVTIQGLRTVVDSGESNVPQVATEITTQDVLFNFNSNFSILSLIQSTEDTGARWEIFIDGRNQSVDANSPLSRWLTSLYTQNSMPVALVMQAYTFVAGSVVSFRIYAESTGTSTTSSGRRLQTSSGSVVSYSEISVSINGPPSDGEVTCLPTSGSALTTTFAVSTSNWVDTNPADFPLRYVFQYSLAPGVLPSLTIQSLSALSTVSSQFPAGLQSYDYSLTLFVTAYDVHDADSTPAQTNITVKMDSSVNFTSYLTDNLAASIASGDVSAAFQALGNVASMLNVVNCSAASASYCASLHRAPCVDTPNTCGSCLAGYTGIVGNANRRCFDMSSGNVTGLPGSSCTTDDDCLYGSCSSSVCIVPLMTCPSSVSEQECSGHGACSYRDNSGRTIASSSCTITNVDCNPTCVCSDGYGGRDCSLSREALLERSSLRGSLCGGINSLQSNTDESTSILSSLSGSLVSSYSPFEVVSDGDYSLCSSALTGVAELAAKGYLEGASVSVVENLVSSVSFFVDSSLNVTAERASAVQDALNNVAAGVASSLSAGHYPLEVTSNNVRLSVHRDFVADLTNQTFSPPQTAAEAAYGKLASTMVFHEQSNVSACSDGTGYVKLAIAGYGRNPFPNSTRVESPMLRLSSETAASSSASSASSSAMFSAAEHTRELLQSQSMESQVPDNSVAAYYFTVQFMSEQDFSYNLTAAQIAAGGNNLTFPECRIYDSDAGSYKVCPGCLPATYTNFNVTFVCSDIGEICGGGSGRRRLQGDDDGSGGSSSFSIQQYGAIMEAAAEAFVSVLSRNPFAVNIRQAAAILSLVGSLVVVFVSVGVYLYRMDAMEAEESVVQKIWPPHVEHRAVLRDVASWLCGCVPWIAAGAYKAKSKHKSSTSQSVVSPRPSRQQLLKKSDFLDERGSPLVKATLSPAKQSSLMPDRLGSKLSSRDEFDVQTTEDMHLWTKVVLDTVIPDVFRQTGLASFAETVMRTHSYLLMFTHASYSAPRFVRWIQFCKSILLALFIDTLFFQVFYGNDGTCELYTAKATCLQAQNAATGNPKCAWQYDSSAVTSSKSSGSCSLREPPQDFTFTIMLALLTMLIAIPIDVGLSMVVDVYCNRKPDWSKWRMDEDRLLGRETREAERTFEEQRKSYTGALNALLREEAKATNRSFVGLVSVEEEINVLKERLSEHFQQSVMVYPSLSAAQQEAWLEVKQARSEAIRKWFRIAEDGKVIRPPWYAQVVGQSWQGRLVEQLETVIAEQTALQDTLGKLDDDASFLGDMILLQTFALEQVSEFQKWVLVSKLSCFDDYTTTPIHPYKWIGGWLLVLSVCTFFAYWVFAWGVGDGDAMLRAWGANYGIGLVQDVLFVDVAKTILFYLIGREVILPQLCCIHQQLSKLAMERQNGWVSARKGLAQASFRVVGVVSPSVRVANIWKHEQSGSETRWQRKSDDEDTDAVPELSDVVQLLANMDDYDVLQCQLRHTNRFGWAGWLIVFVPVLLAMFGEQMADVSLDMAMPTCSSAFLLLNSVLQQIGWRILVIPYAVGLALWLWRVGLFRWIEGRLVALEAESAAARRPVQRDNELQAPSQVNRLSRPTLIDVDVAVRRRYLWWKLLRLCEPTLLYRLVYVLHPTMRQNEQERRRHQKDTNWRRRNLPHECQPVLDHRGGLRSVLMQLPSHERNELMAHEAGPIVLPPDLTSALMSGKWRDQFDVVERASAVDDRSSFASNGELLNVRCGDALQQWVVAYQRHYQRTSVLRKPRAQSVALSFYKRYTVTHDTVEALVRIVELYGTLHWHSDGGVEGVVCREFPRSAAKKLLRPFVHAKRVDASPKHRPRRMVNLRVASLVAILRELMGRRNALGIQPKLRSVSDEELSALTTNLSVWARQATPSEDAASSSAGQDEDMHVSLEAFVGWFTFVFACLSQAPLRRCLVFGEQPGDDLLDDAERGQWLHHFPSSNQVPVAAASHAASFSFPPLLTPSGAPTNSPVRSFGLAFSPLSVDIAPPVFLSFSSFWSPRTASTEATSTG